MDLSGWVGVGLEGNCDCRCGILYATMRTFCSRQGFGLPPGFCCVRVCVGLAHLVFYGRENKCVKCRNG